MGDVPSLVLNIPENGFLENAQPVIRSIIAWNFSNQIQHNRYLIMQFCGGVID